MLLPKNHKDIVLSSLLALLSFGIFFFTFRYLIHPELLFVDVKKRNYLENVIIIAATLSEKFFPLYFLCY